MHLLMLSMLCREKTLVRGFTFRLPRQMHDMTRIDYLRRFHCMGVYFARRTRAGRGVHASRLFLTQSYINGFTCLAWSARLLQKI
jgi:hypothetical protein